jgi:hypothetical protein
VALVIGAVAGVGLGAWLGRRQASSILLPLLFPGLAVLAYVPGVIALFPFVAAVSGPLLDLLLLGCLVASLWRLGAHFGWTPRITADGVAVAALCVYLVVGYRIQQTVGLSGDEPHYLLVAHSLIHDGDLRVAEDYKEESFREFFSGKMGPHLAHGTPYSVHGVGLPLLLLPGFALLGLGGVLLTEALLGAFTVREVYRAGELLTDNRTAALLAAVGFGVTTPALFLCTAAYPELPAAALTVALFRRWLSPSNPSSVGATAWGLAIGLLAFFHMKFLPLAAVLALGSMVRWPKTRWWVLVGTSCGLLALLAFFSFILGHSNPLAAYGRQRIFWSAIPRGLAGLLFDQEFGLLPVSPFYLFGLAAMGSLVRLRASLGLWVLGALAAVALPGAAHPLWSGGSSAPARFLFPALPLLAVAAGAAWNWEPRRGIQPWARSLLITSLTLGAYMAWAPGHQLQLHINQRDGTGRLWEALGTSWDLTHYLPSVVAPDGRSIVMLVAGVALLLLVFIAHLSARRFRLPPLALGALLATLLVDHLSPGMAPGGSRARWMEHLLWNLPVRRDQRLFVMPQAQSLRFREAVALIHIPLVEATSRRVGSGESDVWESDPFRLPAGEYVVDGKPPGVIELCNGEGCFSRSDTRSPFRTRINLAHFRVRRKDASPELSIRVSSLPGASPTAEQSLELPNGARLHSLDDNVFIEPQGFWVRAGTRAQFVLEDGRGNETVLSLANGGQENWIVVQQPHDRLRFSLRPWESKRLRLRLANGLGVFAVEAAAGFQPPEADPGKPDRRQLGVFVSAPVFDLSREPS